MADLNRRYNQRRLTTTWTPLSQNPEASPGLAVSSSPASTTPPKQRERSASAPPILSASPASETPPKQRERAASAPPILSSDGCPDTETDDTDIDGESQRSSSPDLMTPPPSPVTPTPVKSEDMADEMDGVASLAFFNAVKAAVLHLLNITLHKFRREQCFGCQINHPSQRHHPCLENVEDHYYQINFRGIMKMLFTPHLIPSIQRLLTARNIREDDARVKAVAQTLLHELRSTRNIQDSIGSMYDELIGEDVFKIGELKLVADIWESE